MGARGRWRRFVWLLVCVFTTHHWNGALPVVIYISRGIAPHSLPWVLKIAPAGKWVPPAPILMTVFLFFKGAHTCRALLNGN